MTKINRLLSIDYELNEKLKDIDNVSALVNRLLLDHLKPNNSDDIGFLTKKVGEYDLEIKTLEINRDSMTERVKLLSEKAKNYEKEKEANISINNKSKDLVRWLSQKVKEKVITFEEFRQIKHFPNFEDCMESVISGDLDLAELVEKTKPKDLNTTTTTN